MGFPILRFTKSVGSSPSLLTFAPKGPSEKSEGLFVVPESDEVGGKVDPTIIRVGSGSGRFSWLGLTLIQILGIIALP